LEREDPKLRSGIVLVGANHADTTALNLSGTQL
jgi:hypothetical protein